MNETKSFRRLRVGEVIESITDDIHRGLIDQAIDKAYGIIGLWVATEDIERIDELFYECIDIIDVSPEFAIAVLTASYRKVVVSKSVYRQRYCEEVAKVLDERGENSAAILRGLTV